MKTDLSKRVLIVDDDADMRDYLRREFELEDFVVFEESSAEGALDQIAKNRFDLVVSDVQMPGRDGMHLVRSLNAAHNDAPAVILMSGFTKYTTEQVLAAGALALITKPIDIPALFQHVECALAKRKMK